MRSSSESKPMPIAKSREHDNFGGVFGPIRRLCWSFAEWIQMDAVFEAQFNEEVIDRGRPDI
jgi:hypothetical protein